MSAASAARWPIACGDLVQFLGGGPLLLVVDISACGGLVDLAWRCPHGHTHELTQETVAVRRIWPGFSPTRFGG